jgi:hypothetical protein
MTDEQTPYEAPQVEEIATDGEPVAAVPGQSIPPGV